MQQFSNSPRPVGVKNKFIGFTSLVMLALVLVMISNICSCDRLAGAKKLAAERNQAIWAQAKREQRPVPILKFRQKVKIGQLVEEKLWVSDIAFDPGSKKISVTMASQQGARVIVFDENQNVVSQWPVDIFAGDNPSAHLKWSLNGLYLGFEASSGGHMFQVWNASSGKIEAESSEPASIMVVANSNGEKVAALDEEDFISVFDWAKRTKSKIGIPNFHIYGMQWVDSQILLIDGNQRPRVEQNRSIKTLCCINPSLKRTLAWIDLQREVIIKTRSLQTNDVYSQAIQISRNSKYFFLGDGIFYDSIQEKITPIATFAKLLEKGIPVPQRSKDIFLSQSGRYLLIKGGDPRSESMLVLLDTATGDPLYWMSAGFRGFALSPDEKTLVLGDKDSLLYYDLIETPAP